MHDLYKKKKTIIKIIMLYVVNDRFSQITSFKLYIKYIIIYKKYMEFYIENV